RRANTLDLYAKGRACRLTAARHLRTALRTRVRVSPERAGRYLSSHRSVPLRHDRSVGSSRKRSKRTSSRPLAEAQRASSSLTRVTWWAAVSRASDPLPAPIHTSTFEGRTGSAGNRFSAGSVV